MVEFMSCLLYTSYYLLAENTPAGKEGETVLTLVNLYQEAEEGDSSSSSAGGGDSFEFDAKPSSRSSSSASSSSSPSSSNSSRCV